MVTRVAAHEYGFDFRYKSRPSWQLSILRDRRPFDASPGKEMS